MSREKEARILAEEIEGFLSEHARISPDWDPSYDPEEYKYTSPDASELSYVATMLREGEYDFDYPRSSWESGGYSPYSDKDAKERHDRLLEKIKSFQKE